MSVIQPQKIHSDFQFPVQPFLVVVNEMDQLNEPFPQVQHFTVPRSTDKHLQKCSCFFVNIGFVFVIIMLYICNIKYNEMIGSSAVKVQTAFRLNKDLIRRLKMKAKKENRSLNNYVETVLMDIVYNDPNDETIAAIEEARSGKPMEKLDVDNLDGFVAEL